MGYALAYNLGVRALWVDLSIGLPEGLHRLLIGLSMVYR